MSNYQSILIARPEDVHKRVHELKNRSDDVKARIALQLKQLWDPERELRAVSAQCDFLILRQRFPQFSEVIDFLENAVISMAHMGLPFEVPPILLQGDPGLGKTFFASEFAKLVDLPFKEISMATTTSSFVLSGGSLQWAEGSPGEIVKLMAGSPCANPIVLVDELDKVSAGQKYNAANSLYGLLEPHSSKRFRDEALEINLDVSRVMWIGTGNDMDEIPTPIQSRMRVFEIKQPEPVEMQSVVKSIYLSIRETKAYGKMLDEDMDQEIVEALSHMSPRAVRLSLEESLFKVIRERRTGLKITDLVKTRKEARRVGFI